MNILYITSEAAPFCKTGGLGDVAGALPRALAARGAQVRVALPLYESVGEDWRREMEFVRMLHVQLSWRNHSCGVYQLHRGGVTWYFLENDYYFGRRELYGHYDDGERFAFFCKAVLDMLPALGWWPDVVHANDWQSALVPVYLRTLYANDLRYAALRTVCTIHNIQYQGAFSRGFLEDVAGIDDRYFQNGELAWNEGVNLLKGAVLYADAVTTVSPSYAREIQTAYYAHGLDAVLRERAGALSGVLNGIAPEDADPAADPALAVRYGPGSLSGKRGNKAALQRLLGLREEPDTPVVAVLTRLAEHKGIDLIAAVADDIMNEPLQLCVLGRGEWRYEQMFDQLRRRYPGRVSVNILFSEDLAHKIYAGADMLLMPSKSEPCGLAQLIALRYGTVPVVRRTGGLADTVPPWDPETGEGLGFCFDNYNAHEMLSALRQGLTLYRDRAAWESLARRGMEADYGWGRSAGAYMDIYRRALEGSGGKNGG